MFSSITASAIFFLTLSFFSVFMTNADDSPCSRRFTKLKFKNYTAPTCQKLGNLGFDFSWKIDEKNFSQVDIIFGGRLHREKWIAWGLNPFKPTMVGTRAIIGIKQPDGSFSVDTYNITLDTKIGCRLKPSEIELNVQQKEYEFIGLDYVAIHVRLNLPAEYSITRLNHVWQVGHFADGLEPKMHSIALQNVDSAETINLQTGDLGSHLRRHRNYIIVHGIINIIGWGILLPCGVICARYLKYPLTNFRPWMFSLHVTFQSAGYILGSTGFLIGVWLGNRSKDYSFNKHRLYSILIFTFTTVQMLAIRLRPKKADDFRKYWNMYHHFLGYALTAVIPINIFLGTSIVRPEHQVWRSVYIGALAVFAFIVLVLEIYTWISFWNSKKRTEDTNSRDSKRQSTSDTPTEADKRSQNQQANQHNQITPSTSMPKKETADKNSGDSERQRTSNTPTEADKRSQNEQANQHNQITPST